MSGRQPTVSFSSGIRPLPGFLPEKAANTTFTPMISKPIIPVEIKIVSLLRHIEKRGAATLEELIIGEATLPDLIASFLGVLELVKIRKLLLADDIDEDNALLSANTRFILNTDDSTVGESEYLSAAALADEQ